uniref:VWFC domain-containing protein n=1 Tax=Glossina pallidipes TaxID=7398 RepID=A0A1A9ZID9_GLOPL
MNSKLLYISECHFGKTLHELGSSWSADLGPPFGVMYCIKCECVKVPKKKRIVARVQCRNIKEECPTTTCDEPVSLPGKCCKTCPSDKHVLALLREYVDKVLGYVG